MTRIQLLDLIIDNRTENVLGGQHFFVPDGAGRFAQAARDLGEPILQAYFDGAGPQVWCNPRTGMRMLT